MNTSTKSLVAGFAIGTAAWIAVLAQTSHEAQSTAPEHTTTPPEGVNWQEPPRERPPIHSPMPKIIEALDVNQDWEISAEEIANAPEALKVLDVNHDGKLTMNEILPPPPQGARAVKHEVGTGRTPGKRGTVTHQRERPATQ